MQPDFNKSRKLATELLLCQNTDSLFFDVRQLKYNKKICIDSIQDYCKTVNAPLTKFINPETNALKEGCTIKLNDYHFVLYNEEETQLERLNWTLGHEIGHIYLEHERDGDKEEVEAHFFAAQLLMPEEILREIIKKYGPIPAQTLCLIFFVSYTAAQKRLITLEKKKSCIYDENGKKLIEKYQSLIDNSYASLFRQSPMNNFYKLLARHM